MFGDNPQFEASDLPSVRTVRKIHRLARRFFKENLAESSWNNDVHSKRLEWVMRDSPSSDDDLLDYRCRLCWGRRDPIDAIEFLPGIIVIKHDWYFVATDLDRFGKARTFERIPLGSTESILGIYKLSMSLLKLCQWVRDQYWPAFQADILNLEAQVASGEAGAA
ncbi:hypothetical protein B0J15DRAFT_544796 [Fusarium solani]|uniref:PD-(D/E)XK nuclease-like domain-containing protein n=2 Tax=Fusarium solani TaxID=169388 RepID=A0A9P9KSX3_FUSSL|nr:uncharacterized protein B0J15DRAFT_544796 [Fusarium solani]KAH7267902.1 hypothetical protein B0J15DRAFT_544796 [Fusarium solani]